MGNNESIVPQPNKKLSQLRALTMNYFFNCKVYVPGAAQTPGGQTNLSAVALEEDGAAGITLFNHKFSFEIVQH